MADVQDPLIAELVQTQRDRGIIVVAAVIGIIASAACGIAFGLGALGHLGAHAAGARNPGGLLFFVAPFALCYGLGHALYAVVRRARPRYEPEPVEPESDGASEARYSVVAGRFSKSARPGTAHPRARRYGAS